MTRKVCTNCKVERHEVLFTMQAERRGRKAHRRGKCKLCVAATYKAWYARNAETQRAKASLYWKEVRKKDSPKKKQSLYFSALIRGMARPAHVSSSNGLSQ